MSEDALSALEAEVGQARRAEVVALARAGARLGGRRRCRDAPDRRRSDAVAHQHAAQEAAAADRAAPVEASAAKVDEREAQRKRRSTTI